MTPTDCGCCAGADTQTPALIENRPGLDTIRYRAGTHTQFKSTLLARLSESGLPALNALRTRSDDDFSIALLDAWAAIGDVLTFYQERIANESYLGTAAERLSLLELARLIGYELRPGVAASAYLAITVEDPPGVTRQTAASYGLPRKVLVGPGLKVQSVPAPGDHPQTFETVESIEARVEWNAMRPRLTQRHPISANAPQLFFDGLATGLKPGDGLLLQPDDGSSLVFRQVASLTPNNDQMRTEVQLQPVPAPAAAVVHRVFSNSGRARFSEFFNTSFGGADLIARSIVDRFDIVDLFENLTALRPPPPGVFALRSRSSIFGHNAPAWASLPATQRVGEFVFDKTQTPPQQVFKDGIYSARQSSWADTTTLDSFPETRGASDIFLDSVYPGIVPNSFVALKNGGKITPFQVSDAAETSISDFTLNAKVTRLTLNTSAGLSDFSIRGTTVFGQSEQLPLARLPIDAAVSGGQVDLDTWIDGLARGQKLMICGELDQTRGVNACELATIQSYEQLLDVEGFTRITFSAPLANSYVRTTVTIGANVALATHGETVQGAPGSDAEVLGSGDSTVPFQRFALRQPPLTFVSSAGASGAQTTLTVRVNDVLWHEVPYLYGQASGDRIYVTRLDDSGNTTVIFGNGQTGARLPTGQGNIQAHYRRGIGLAGQVKANQLTQLMLRPLGIKAVTNPMDAGGAADPENIADARRNAPLTVLTLDRVVSLQDYEDFARAFAGIGKALAVWLWRGERRVVFLTVAGPGGAAIPADSVLYANLLQAIGDAGDPGVPLAADTYVQRLFQIAAAVTIDPDLESAVVLGAIDSAMRAAFSFDARAFGQSVNKSEVLAVMHSAHGVIAVNLTAFFRSDQASSLQDRLDAGMPRLGGTAIVPAEQLTLDPRPLNLTVTP